MAEEGGARRAGWGAAAALGAAALLLWVLDPFPLFAVSLATLVLLLPPHRAVVSVAAAVVLGGALMMAPARDAMAGTTVAWAAGLGVAFAAATRFAPGWGVLSRALAALGASLAGAAAWFAGTGRWTAFDEVLRERFRRAGSQMVAQLGGEGATGVWPEQLRAAMEQGVEAQGVLYPAIAALQSLAVLVFAWVVFARLAQGRWIAPRPFRELRFDDAWTWAVVGGLLLVLLPLGPPAQRIGANALFFMGGLYALRGVAVLAFLAAGAPPAVTVFVAAAATLFFTPVAVAVAALLGLGDTWLDVRGRVADARSA